MRDDEPRPVWMSLLITLPTTHRGRDPTFCEKVTTTKEAMFTNETNLYRFCHHRKKLQFQRHFYSKHPLCSHSGGRL
jgi:hypothetical protein